MSTTRLRVTSDGTPEGTRVVTEDGTLVKGVQMVSWQLTVTGMARLQVELLGVAVDLVGLVETEGSMPKDPTAVVELAVPQEPPEGPGFPEWPTVDQEHDDDWYRCPECRTLYDDADQICVGDDIKEHQPVKVVPAPEFVDGSDG